MLTKKPNQKKKKKKPHKSYRIFFFFFVKLWRTELDKRQRERGLYCTEKSTADGSLPARWTCELLSWLMLRPETSLSLRFAFDVATGSGLWRLHNGAFSFTLLPDRVGFRTRLEDFRLHSAKPILTFLFWVELLILFKFYFLKYPQINW